MRGEDGSSGSLFSYVDLESRVPAKHPLRAIREVANDVLSGLTGEVEALYSHTGRPGIAPEKLLRALLVQAFYSLRSERQLMEQLEFNLLFRWFVGLDHGQAVIGRQQGSRPGFQAQGLEGPAQRGLAGGREEGLADSQQAPAGRLLARRAGSWRAQAREDGIAGRLRPGDEPAFLRPVGARPCDRDGARLLRLGARLRA